MLLLFYVSDLSHWRELTNCYGFDWSPDWTYKSFLFHPVRTKTNTFFLVRVHRTQCGVQWKIFQIFQRYVLRCTLENFLIFTRNFYPDVSTVHAVEYLYKLNCRHNELLNNTTTAVKETLQTSSSGLFSKYICNHKKFRCRLRKLLLYLGYSQVE